MAGREKDARARLLSSGLEPAVSAGLVWRTPAGDGGPHVPASCSPVMRQDRAWKPRSSAGCPPGTAVTINQASDDLHCARVRNMHDTILGGIGRALRRERPAP